MKINTIKFVKSAKPESVAILIVYEVAELDSELCVLVTKDGACPHLPDFNGPGAQCGNAVFSCGRLGVDETLVVPGWTIRGHKLVANGLAEANELREYIDAVRFDAERAAQAHCADSERTIRKNVLASFGIVEHS